MIAHLAAQADWEQALATGRYAPASLAVDGFLHFSTGEQLQEVADRLFAGRDDVVLLLADEEALGAEVRWEPPDPDDGSGRLFPHVYGPVPVGQVHRALPVGPGPDGRLILPPVDRG